MKNKRGFTLVEVLGVIVILLLLLLIITPLVTSNLKKAHKDAKDVQDYTLKEAAKSWMSAKENISLMPVIENDCIEVTLRELKEGGYIDNDIKDPETKELLRDDITLIIRKTGNDLTYEVNNGSQTCNVVVDSVYPRWTYVSSNKSIISKNDTLVIKIKSTPNVKEYNLTNDKIIIKANGQIIDDAVINNISCTGTDEITCEITISNINKDGRLNIEIAKDTLTSNDNIKSKVTPVLTDVIVDNEGPRIKYVGRENNNSSLIYANSSNTVIVIFDTLDSNITTDTIQTEGIDVYVNGVVNSDIEKSLTRTSVDGGYRYRLSLSNLTGNGLLTVKVKKDQVSDVLGIKNMDTVLNSGITIDNKLPEITFNEDGTTGYQKTVTTVIMAKDENGIKEPIEYIWTKDSSKTTYDQSGSNNKSTSLSGVSGSYYLIAKACDLAGNCTRKVSNIFYLSNEGPTITFTPNGNSGYETKKVVRVSVVSGGAPLDAGSLKYSISQSADASATKEFNNNSDITLDNISGTYYLIVSACDTLGNCTKKVSNGYKVDGEPPKITYIGKTNTNRTSGRAAEYTTKNDTVTVTLEGTDNLAYNDSLQEGDVTVKVGGTTVPATVSISKTNITKGKRYVITLTNITGNGALLITINNAKITDNAGNKARVGILNLGITVDNTKPVITFGTNGNSTYEKSQSSTINVSDNYSINSDTRKYIWTKTPSSATPNVAFVSGGTYTKDSVTDDYYIKATTCDEAGNCETVTSNVFKIDNTKPTITFGTNGNTNPAKTQSSTINVSDSHAGGDTTTYKYVWSKTPSSATPNTAFTSGQTYTQPNGDGNYYIKAYACDKAGNCDTVTSNAFLLDNTAPTCSFSGENTTWTKNTVTVTATCSDTNGCTTATASNKWTYSSGTHKTEAVSYQISDGAGNSASCSKTISVYVDKTAPTTPNCSAPSVSGSTVTVNAPAASGSTDDVTAAANIKYYYLVNNNGTTPANTNTGFTTSRSYNRACGTSYYVYTIAEDAVGNRSAVKYCGSTSDPASNYSAWSACYRNGVVVSCGGGTQTRTNPCPLKTDLSQACATQSCTYDARYVEYDATASVQTGTYTVTAHSVTTSGNVGFPAFEGYYQLWFDDKFVANGITYEPGVRYNRHARGYFGCHFLVVDDRAGHVVFRKGQDSSGTNEVDGLCTDELNTGAGNPEAYFGLYSTAAGGLSNMGQTVTQNFTGYMTKTTYSCPSGGSLSGSKCWYYDCPNGGTLNNSNHKCEF